MNKDAKLDYAVRMEAQVYTIKTAAAALSCSETTIRRRIKDGTLKATRFGQQWRIKREDIEAILNN